MEDSRISETIKDLIRESEQLSISLPRVSESVAGWGTHLTPKKPDSREKLTSKINFQSMPLKKVSQVYNPRTLIRPSYYPEVQLKHNSRNFAKPWQNFKALKKPKRVQHPRCTCLSLQQSPEHSCASPIHIPKHESLTYSEFPKREQKHIRFQFNSIDFNKEIAQHIFSYRKTLREIIHSPQSSPVSKTPALKTKYKRTRQFSWGNDNTSILKP